MSTQTSDRTHPSASTLRQERIRMGWSQLELAKLSGLHQADISRIESGKRPLSLAETTRFAELFDIPLQMFLTGTSRPGTHLRELASELRSLGMVDLLVADVQAPGAFRPSEEVIACAVGTERPDPRIIEALPAVLAWNRWRSRLMDAFARCTHRRAVTRLAWLVEITLTIERTEGFPGRLISGDDLTEFLNGVNRPEDSDDLGHPEPTEMAHRTWKYWRIQYPATPGIFRERALLLWSLRSGQQGKETRNA